MPELTFLGREICCFVFVFLKILGFSTTKNSSPEIFDGMFGEERDIYVIALAESCELDKGLLSNI